MKKCNLEKCSPYVIDAFFVLQTMHLRIYFKIPIPCFRTYLCHEPLTVIFGKAYLTKGQINFDFSLNASLQKYVEQNNYIIIIRHDRVLEKKKTFK